MENLKLFEQRSVSVMVSELIDPEKTITDVQKAHVDMMVQLVNKSFESNTQEKKPEMSPIVKNYMNECTVSRTQEQRLADP